MLCAKLENQPNKPRTVSRRKNRQTKNIHTHNTLGRRNAVKTESQKQNDVITVLRRLTEARVRSEQSCDVSEPDFPFTLANGIASSLIVDVQLCRQNMNTREE